MFKSKKIALLTGVATLFSATAPAYAAGVTSGTNIQNTATVSYNVGNVAQTPVTSNTDAFVVDRKIILKVDPIGPATPASPGQTKVVQTFRITNTSNASIDALLTAANLPVGTVPSNGGTGNNDNFQVTNIVAFVDTNGNGVQDAGEANYVTGLAADASVVVTVISDVPLGQATGDRAVVSLTATAAQGGNATTAPTAIAQTAGNNTKAGVETVFADAAGTDDAATDGKSSARNDIVVSAAALSVNKTSVVARDGLAPGASFPAAKAIPGAFVQYCIAVTNAANGATATDLSINDVVAANMTVQLASILVGATQNTTTGQCTGGTAPVAANNTSSGNTVTVRVPSLAPGVTTAVSFEAQIK